MLVWTAARGADRGADAPLALRCSITARRLASFSGRVMVPMRLLLLLLLSVLISTAESRGIYSDYLGNAINPYDCMVLAR